MDHMIKLHLSNQEIGQLISLVETFVPEPEPEVSLDEYEEFKSFMEWKKSQKKASKPTVSSVVLESYDQDQPPLCEEVKRPRGRPPNKKAEEPSTSDHHQV